MAVQRRSPLRHGRRDGDPFLWGDEMDCLLLQPDDASHLVSVEEAQHSGLEKAQPKHYNAPSLQPELRTFILETTTSKPFGADLAGLLTCQEDFFSRREQANATLPKGSQLATLLSYPRYGADEDGEQRVYSPVAEKNSVTPSGLVSDDHIASVSQYRSILGNIIQKRGKRVEIHVPLSPDVGTAWLWKDSSRRGRDNAFFMD